MKDKLKLLCLFITMSILLLSSFSCVVQPAQENKQGLNQPQVFNVVETVIVTIPAFGPRTPRPTSIPVTVEAEGDVLELQLNINKMPNITLKLNQKLVIIPDWNLGQEGWWVGTPKPKLLTLDPEIDSSKPPETGWVWTPHEIGSTSIVIREPGAVGGDVPPVRGVKIGVQVIEAP